jgi:hypothetical protein
MTNREQIYIALFTLLSGIPGLKTTSRRLVHWVDVPKSQQPALFQAQKTETPTTTTGQPSRWTLHVDVYLYCHSSDPTVVPMTIANAILDQITSVLDMQPAFGKQTLGGLVNYCRIQGPIQTDEGVLDDQSVCIIPVEIMVT